MRRYLPGHHRQYRYGASFPWQARCRNGGTGGGCQWVAPREAIAFVGDRLYTDVACGTQNGACGILVMTGEATPEMLAESSFFPDAVFPSLGAMAPLL